MMYIHTIAGVAPAKQMAGPEGMPSARAVVPITLRCAQGIGMLKSATAHKNRSRTDFAVEQLIRSFI